LFTPTSKSGWYKCQLETQEISVNNGLITTSKRVAFPAIDEKTVKALQSMGIKNGDEFPLQGKIVRKLTNTPQFEGHEPVVNPSDGTVMDYYQTYTFTTNLKEQDVDERVTVEVEDTEEVAAGVGEGMKPNESFEQKLM